MSERRSFGRPAPPSSCDPILTHCSALASQILPPLSEMEGRRMHHGEALNGHSVENHQKAGETFAQVIDTYFPVHLAAAWIERSPIPKGANGVVTQSEVRELLLYPVRHSPELGVEYFRYSSNLPHFLIACRFLAQGLVEFAESVVQRLYGSAHAERVTALPRQFAAKNLQTLLPYALFVSLQEGAIRTSDDFADLPAEEKEVLVKRALSYLSRSGMFQLSTPAEKSDLVGIDSQESNLVMRCPMQRYLSDLLTNHPTLQHIVAALHHLDIETARPNFGFVDVASQLRNFQRYQRLESYKSLTDLVRYEAGALLNEFMTPIPSQRVEGRDKPIFIP